MISLNGVDLGQYGLHVKPNGYRGLLDFPTLKNTGNNWIDQDYTEAPQRLIEMQFEPRVITIDCFVVGSRWSDLTSKLTGIKKLLTFNGLKILRCSDVSERSYVVFLQKSTILNPYKYFKNTKMVAEFKLVFEEPQPFNVQFWWDATSVSKLVSIIINKSPKANSGESHRQSYINIWRTGGVVTHSLEKSDYELSLILSSGYGVYPLVITGAIDDIATITVNSQAQGVVCSESYLRNGIVTVV